MPEYSYGRRSKANLITCSFDIQRVFQEAIKHRDISITEGNRSNALQAEALAKGTSQLGPGESKHNVMPSKAVDAIPYPTTEEDWENREYWVEWSSWIKGLATGMGITLISGFDWDNDFDLDDQKFYDGPHFEEA